MFFPKKMPNSLTSCFDLKKSFCQQNQGLGLSKIATPAKFDDPLAGVACIWFHFSRRDNATMKGLKHDIGFCIHPIEG